MDNEFLEKLRSLYMSKQNHTDSMLERCGRDGIVPFIDRVLQCRADLAKAENHLRAACILADISPNTDLDALVASPTSNTAAPKGPDKAADRKYVSSAQVLEAVIAALCTEPKGFTLKELEAKTSFSRQQVAKAAKQLVKEGKVTESTDSNAKNRGFPTKIYTWKG